MFITLIKNHLETAFFFDPICHRYCSPFCQRNFVQSLRLGASKYRPGQVDPIGHLHTEPKILPENLFYKNDTRLHPAIGISMEGQKLRSDNNK